MSTQQNGSMDQSLRVQALAHMAKDSTRKDVQDLYNLLEWAEGMVFDELLDLQAFVQDPTFSGNTEYLARLNRDIAHAQYIQRVIRRRRTALLSRADCTSN